MSRSPDRIDPFLRRLAALWHVYPDWRFGQLVMNLSRTPDGFADIWEWDCSSFSPRMQELWDAALGAESSESS